MRATIDRVEGRSLKSGVLVIVVQIAIIASFLAVAIAYPSFYHHPEGYIYPVCVALLFLFAWTLLSWGALTGNWFDPYTLFIIAAFAFNAGLAFLEVFHVNKDGILGGLFSPTLILQTLLLVTIGLTAFHSGALLVAFLMGERATPVSSDRSLEQEGRPLRVVGWTLIAIAVVPTMIVLKQSIATVNSLGYGGLFQQQISAGLGAWSSILSAFLVPGSLFLLAGSRQKRLGKYVSFGIILVYCALLFFLGERGHAIMPILAYLWLFHRVVRRVPVTAIAVFALLLLVFVIPMLSVFRSATGPERYSWSEVVRAFKSVKNPALAGLAEMGGSMQTVAYTIELVPSTRAYDMGDSYYYATLTAVPNFFWRVHPAVARGLASDWLIREVDPFTAGLGGGLGYSFIAEAYLNFGWWGVPLVLGLIGLLFGGFVLWAGRSGDIARLATVASFLSFFLLFARGEAALVVRALVWYSILPYLAVLYLRHAAALKERTVMSNLDEPYAAGGWPPAARPEERSR